MLRREPPSGDSKLKAHHCQLLLTTAAIAWCAVHPAHAASTRAADQVRFDRDPERVLVNVIGASGATLWIANADGSDERPLLAHPRFDYNASFGGHDRWIVFTSERGGSADIYRARPDGSELERLTDDPAYDDQAALSPDGERVAFISTRDGGFANLHVLDLKTRTVRRLASADAGSFRPAWSPDGQWIAFSSDRDTRVRRAEPRWEQLHETSIYLIRADGTELRRMSAPGKHAGSPKWSADGSRLVFYEMEVGDTYNVRRWGDAARGESQIVSLRIENGHRQTLTSGEGLKVSPQYLGASGENVGYLVRIGDLPGLAHTSSTQIIPGEMRSPAWSMDGRRVVYHNTTGRVFAQNQRLFSLRPEFALSYSDPFPAYSSDGTRLAFCDKLGSAQPGALAALSVADSTGHDVRRIFQQTDSLIVTPTWTPDREHLVFGVGQFFAHRSQPARLMMIRADGSEPRTLPSGPGNSGFPSCSPDGKRIVYRVWGDNERGLRVLNLADGTSASLTDGYDNFPVWSPTGSLIAFTRMADDDSDIFTIRPDGTDLRRLTTAPGNDAHCSWSPDGTQLLFSSSRFGFKDEAALTDGIPQPYAELFVMNADGSDQRPLTDNQWEEGTPAWQPRPREDASLAQN